MKFYVILVGNPQKTLAKIRIGLVDEFRKPNSELQRITKLKEIKQIPGESIWHFDQRFKTIMAKVIFHISVVQHKEWFIDALLPHI